MESESDDSFVVRDSAAVELEDDGSEEEFDFDDEETSSSDEDEVLSLHDDSSSEDEAAPAKKPQRKGKAPKLPRGARTVKRKPWESDEEDTPARRQEQVPFAVIHRRAVTEAQAQRHIASVLETAETYPTPSTLGRLFLMRVRFWFEWIWACQQHLPPSCCSSEVAREAAQVPCGNAPQLPTAWLQVALQRL